MRLDIDFGLTSEVEGYVVELDNVRTLELVITPDKSGRHACASLEPVMNFRCKYMWLDPVSLTISCEITLSPRH